MLHTVSQREPQIGIHELDGVYDTRYTQVDIRTASYVNHLSIELDKHTLTVALHPQNRLEKVAMRYGTEDARQDTRKDQSPEDGLNENGVLNLAQRGLLDPNLSIKHLSDDISLFVARDPRLILVAIAGITQQRLL